MKREDKLKQIHNALKLFAPNEEYDLSDYDIFRGNMGGYIQIYSIKRIIYVEATMDLPTEISTLFELHELSKEEVEEIYGIIERNDELIETIGIPGGFPGYPGIKLYKATPIYKDLFKTT